MGFFKIGIFLIGCNENDFQNMEVVTQHKCVLGEGPVWDGRNGMIIWIDVLEGIIHQYSIPKNEHTQIEVHQMIGSLALDVNGHFIAALKEGFAQINRDGNIRMLINPEGHIAGNRFNDGKCDPKGRFFAGTMSLTGVENAGGLYVLDRKLTVTCPISDISISNGMAWSPNHRKFYHIDTPSFGVHSYDYDIITGDISNKKLSINIPKNEGAPDGMTIDSDGKLWIAHWGGGQVARWDPITGKKLFTFRVPVSKVTSCVFGGKDLEDLYITSASAGLTKQELLQQPLAGSLFIVKNCGFRGIKAFEFIEDLNG